ncbi:MAG: hypothetical protein ABSC06_28475 [Rhodopila sp.]|jgi:hypothetical protein
MPGTMTLNEWCHFGDTRTIVARRPGTVTGCTCSVCAKRGVLGAFKVLVNAWLPEDFDSGVQPIHVIDGKTLW